MVVTQGDEREISQGLKFCGWFLQSSIQNIDVKKYIQNICYYRYLWVTTPLSIRSELFS